MGLHTGNPTPNPDYLLGKFSYYIILMLLQFRYDLYLLDISSLM
jgi:hypothetical protein